MAKKVKNGLGDQKKNPTDDAQQPLGVTFWHRRQGLWVGFLGRIVVDAGMCGLARSALICSPKRPFSPQNPLKIALRQHPATRLPARHWEIHPKPKKTRSGAEKSWLGAGPELARTWPKVGQKPARNWPKSGQKVIKK